MTGETAGETAGNTPGDASRTSKAMPVGDAVVLLLDGDVLTRSAVAGYLRECGYTVIETAAVTEARAVLEADHRIDVAFLDVDGDAEGDAFALAQWIRRQHVATRVILAAGPARVASEAGDLCEKGPMLAKPYDHQLLEREIRRLLAL